MTDSRQSWRASERPQRVTGPVGAAAAAPRAGLRKVWPRRAMAAAFLAASFAGCRAPSYEQARSSMVEQQLRARGVKDERILAAMATVPREQFIPAGLRQRAYDDAPVSIGYGQTISQPYMVAAMTELLRLRKGDKVLEIGTGSGYHAAVLAELTPQVFSIEIIPGLAERARRTLDRLGYKAVQTMTGDGYKGWKEHAPFDAVIVTCAPDHVPAPLVEQLKVGGRMVVPVGSPKGIQTLYLLEKTSQGLKRKSVMDVVFVPMVREEGKPSK